MAKKASFVSFVRQKVIQRSEQNGRKTAFLPDHRPQRAPAEQAGRKRLGQVFGVRRRM
jgi:hypothetical protein